jgi:uncharacterized membrane protein YhiD involved in acid resistance
MSAQALGAWAELRDGEAGIGLAAHAAVWWSGLAALLCIALLVALQTVLQASVDQGQLRRAIKATQAGQARQCMALLGGRVQESCLLALNEAASLSAQASQTQTQAHAEPAPPVSTRKPRTSP